MISIFATKKCGIAPVACDVVSFSAARGVTLLLAEGDNTISMDYTTGEAREMATAILKWCDEVEK